MDYDTHNINLSNERFISLFDNIIDGHYIINYIYNHGLDERYLNRPLDDSILQMNVWSSVSTEEILLPNFIEQEMIFPEDAECGITLEKPNCKSSCGHYFCRDDITRWLEQRKNELKQMSCPTCRAEITEVFVAKNK